MIRVGLIGVGVMGRTHLRVYAERPDVQVVALSDLNPDRLSGKAYRQGNIEGQTDDRMALPDARRYPEGKDLIADAEVDLVDICLTTPLHREYAEAALATGKHVLVEKPLTRTSEDALALADAAANASGMSMPAMCMRFWPGWDWLKQAIADKRFGRVLAAHFRRLSAHPGGPFYESGELAGGALLDLHIHDTDFIQHCFGKPHAVYSTGYSHLTDEPDHLLTHYHYGKDGPMITAEGGWIMSKGFGFQMQYTVNFEHATAVFDNTAPAKLKLAQNGESKPVDLPPGMGYEYEIAYFLDCIRENRPPQRVTIADAAQAIIIAEAERKSIHTGQIVPLDA